MFLSERIINMSNYVINIVNKEKNIATSKAKSDVARFLSEEGYSVIKIKTFKNRFDKLINTHQLIKKRFNELNKNDVLVIQYPTYLGYRFENKLISQLKKKKVKIVILIHDIDSLRFKNKRQPTLKKEIIELNKADCVIASNGKMAKFLRKKGLNTEMVLLGIFDYYHDQNISQNLIFARELNFAGNLDKSKFIYSYPKSNQVKLNLFGKTTDPSGIPNHLTYKGLFPADTLTLKFTKGFGLVWDGLSSNKIEGLYGKYLKYNNPHKLSLFLSAGMPVVIWKDAALAEFVSKNKIGLLTDSLLNVDKLIDSLTESEYKNMCLNARKLAEKVTHGFFIKRAMKQAKQII